MPLAPVHSIAEVDRRNDWSVPSDQELFGVRQIAEFSGYGELRDAVAFAVHNVVAVVVLCIPHGMEVVMWR